MDNAVATLGDMFISIAVNDLRVWSNNAQFLQVSVVSSLSINDVVA